MSTTGRDRQPALAARALAGVAGGDHVCCAFDRDSDQAACVGRFSRDAIGRDERLLYITDHTSASRLEDLLDTAGIAAQRYLASGQLEIALAGDVYGGPAAFDPERQIAHFDAERRRAAADGFRGLAVMAEMSWAAGDADACDRLIFYEREVQRLFAAADVRGICQYDRRLFGAPVVDAAMAAHGFSIAIGGGSCRAHRGMARISERGGAGMCVAGDVDFASAPYLAARLAEHLEGDGDITVGVRALTFADVAACRVLLQTADALIPPRRLILRGAPPSLVRVLELCQWLDHPALALEAA